MRAASDVFKCQSHTFFSSKIGRFCRYSVAHYPISMFNLLQKGDFPTNCVGARKGRDPVSIVLRCQSQTNFRSANIDTSTF